MNCTQGFPIEIFAVVRLCSCIQYELYTDAHAPLKETDRKIALHQSQLWLSMGSPGNQTTGRCIFPLSQCIENIHPMLREKTALVSEVFFESKAMEILQKQFPVYNSTG